MGVHKIGGRPDDATNSFLWTVSTFGIGPSILETNSRVEVWIPASSSGTDIGAKYASRCTLHGDYDITMDYSLLSWAYQNGVRVGIGMSASGNVNRSSLGAPGDFPCMLFRDVYGTQLLPDTYTDMCNSFQVTADQSGTLRMSRVGDITTVYYLNHVGGWAPIESRSLTANDGYAVFQIWTGNAQFTHQAVHAAFDNVVITATQITCTDLGTVPPSITLERLTPDGSQIRLAWAPSCGIGAQDYGIYEGELGNWYSHTLVDCSDDLHDLAEDIPTFSGNRYYLVVPRNDTSEGLYGTDSHNVQRPRGTLTCVANQTLGSCP